MQQHSILAILLDVGGTLWPLHMTMTPAEADARRLARLRAALPDVSDHRYRDLLDQLAVRAPAVRDRAEQDSERVIRAAGHALGLHLDGGTARAVRQALCLPAADCVSLFQGAHELLALIRQSGRRCVIVSNTDWRDAALMRQDFEALGVSHFIDAIIGSQDIGFRKPHPAIFEAAVRLAGCLPQQCVMIGDDERNDIAPAVALGMRTILVAIEKPKPATSAAHAVAGSLHEAAATLRSWLATATRTPGTAPAPPWPGRRWWMKGRESAS